MNYSKLLINSVQYKLFYTLAPVATSFLHTMPYVNYGKENYVKELVSKEIMYSAIESYYISLYSAINSNTSIIWQWQSDHTV